MEKKDTEKESKVGAVAGGRNDSSASTAEQVSDERVTNALHMMQDHLQQATVISERRAQKKLSEQATSKTWGDAAYEAMEAATQARERQHEHKDARRPQKPRQCTAVPSRIPLKKKSEAREAR